MGGRYCAFILTQGDTSGPSDRTVGDSDYNIAVLFDNSPDLDATHVVLPDDALLACNDHSSSSPSRKSSPSAPFITKQVLEQIRSTIANTIRPAWQSDLPTNFGCAEHGKLKADQWRTALEFDIPVALVKVVASRRKSGNIGDDERAQRIVDHTMDLAMAMAWGLSRHTSQSHAERYMLYMKRYIQDIQKLYPDTFSMRFFSLSTSTSHPTSIPSPPTQI